MRKIDDMLKYLSFNGLTDDEIKETVITSFEGLFENKDSLDKFAMTGDMLQIFEFIIRYHYDVNFITGVKHILHYYHHAYKSRSQEVITLYKDMINILVTKENIMWSSSKDDIDLNDSKIYDFTYKFMQKIGVSLEVNLKSYLIEFYALLRICKGNSFDLNEISQYDFGIIINNILSFNDFDNLLKTTTLNIKLSDWRNIAYHHSYTINGDEITCEYGKKLNKKQFTINCQQLKSYTHEIVRSTNIFYIAHWIFFFDHFDEIIENCRINNLNLINLQDEISESALKTSFLGQGFNIIKIQTSRKLTEVEICDLQSFENIDKENDLKRKIHASQLLYNVWVLYRSDYICIKYYNNCGNMKAKFNVLGSICEKIGNSEKDLAYLASNVDFVLL
jgi:hypothetical protein